MPRAGIQQKPLSVSIITEADTIDELKTAVKEAIQCHFEKDEFRPTMIRLHFVRDEVFAA